MVGCMAFWAYFIDIVPIYSLVPPGRGGCNHAITIFNKLYLPVISWFSEHMGGSTVIPLYPFISDYSSTVLLDTH